MGLQASRSEGPRPSGMGRREEPSAWEYGAAIAGLLVVAALLFFAGCSQDKLNQVDGELIAPRQVDFGLVAVGSRSTQAIEIQNHGAAPVRIVAVEPGRELSSTFPLPKPPSEALGAGKSTKLELAFAPVAEERSGGSLLLYTDSEETPSIEIVVVGEGAFPSITCSSRLDFGRVVLNTKEAQRITCLNNGSVPAPVQVVGKDGEDPDLFQVGTNLVENPFIIEPGESQPVEVIYTAQRLGPARAKALLDVKGAKDSSLEVELEGVGFASDLVAAPDCIHFGAVSIGTTATREVLVVNGGTRNVNFKPQNLLDPSNVFSVVSSIVDGVEAPLESLEPGEQATLLMSFTPPGVGSYEGHLQLHNDDTTNPKLEVCLDGRGGGADLLVKPKELDFGRLGTGMKVRATIFAYNAGTSDGGPLVLKGVSITDRTNFNVIPPSVAQLNPGDAPAEIVVEFSPVVDGDFTAVVTIESNDGDQPTYVVPIRGSARTLAPCKWAAVPTTVRFGSTQVGTDAVLAATIENVGSEECVFAQVEIEKGSHKGFTLPQGSIPYRNVAPGGKMTFPVRFRGDKIGDSRGAVRFTVSDPRAPTARIPLQANAVDGCLVANPPALQFKQQRLSCPPVTQRVEISSQCKSTARITSAGLGSSVSSSGEIEVSGLSAPYDLHPGMKVDLQVTYLPVDDGDDSALFEIVSNLQSLSIPIHGSGTESDVRTDRFSQQPKAAVDILFVLDNSGSMTDKQNDVARGCADFLDYATEQGIDYHVGVTTTGIDPSKSGWTDCPGGVDGGEAGRLFPANGARQRWITPRTPNGAAIFADNVKVGICHWWEEGLEGAYRALSSPLVDSYKAPNTPIPNDGNKGFYRPDARLSVIIVSDEDDHSPQPPSFYSTFFRELKGSGREEMTAVHAIVGHKCGSSIEEGTRYKEVANATGGLVLPICTSDWGGVLGKLAEESFGFRLRFPLSGTPISEVSVSVNGQGQEEGWRYDVGANAVIFDEDAAPPPSASIEISYVPACGT